MKVFLGGTCNGSTWRDQLIPMLKPSVDYFNPVVPNWTPAAQEEELRQRESADVMLYVLTPAGANLYSIAEVVEDSIKRPNNTVLVVLQDDNGKVFEPHAVKAMKAISDMVWRNGGLVFPDLASLATALR
jgi:hypothetical protein